MGFEFGLSTLPVPVLCLCVPRGKQGTLAHTALGVNNVSVRDQKTCSCILSKRDCTYAEEEMGRDKSCMNLCPA